MKTTPTNTDGSSRRPLWRTVMLTLLVLPALCAHAAAADQAYFSAIDNFRILLVQRIDAEQVRIDMSIWLLSEGSVAQALVRAHNRGVPIRLIGDRNSIFENDPTTKTQFYVLANRGVPIRIRFNPTNYPEIAHWKATIFVGQNLVAFGSGNYTPFELSPASATNYKDESFVLSDDPVIVNAFKTKFDQIWNDTMVEAQSRIAGPPYLKNWADACATEPTKNCSDFATQFPNPAPMIIDTTRLEPDNPLPPDIVWGQGSSFNNRLIQEINAEQVSLQMVIYRLTVANIATALRNKWNSGVNVQILIEPTEYTNKKWPEFWLTHAYIDQLWAAGVPIKTRLHDGLTHMKTLVTSTYATNSSSNYAAAWQRDHNYFISAAAKPALYQAFKNRVTAMWNDPAAFQPFQPLPPDAAKLSLPVANATAVSTTAPLVWERAAFATHYDVYLGTTSTNFALVGTVAARLVNDPPATYSWTPSTPLQAGTTYFWRVVSRTFATPVNPSMIATSLTRSFMTAGTAPPPPGSLPTPWASTDVGNVGQAGSASYANGTFTVDGAGADIWGSVDGLRYVHQSVEGDVDIVARLTSIEDTHSFAKAGLMLRQSTAANAAHVILSVRPNGNVEFMRRSTSGAATNWLAGGSQPTPVWLRLVRSGPTVTGYISSDGSTWTIVGSTTVTMGALAQVGLAVTSHNTATLNTSTFDNVAVSSSGSTTPPPLPDPLPAPWASGDIGAVGQAGDATYSNGTFTVAAGGADIWGSADGFRYAYQAIDGDIEIVARLTAIENTNTYAKAGVMLRQSLAANSAHVILDVRPNGSLEFMRRSATGSSTSWLSGGSQPPPAWLRLVRTGTTVTGYVSANGTTWTTVGSTTLAIGTPAYIGLAVTSHNTSVLNTSTFDNVTVIVP